MAKNELGVEAPIVFPDSHELGDTRLDPRENVAKLKEKIRKQRQPHILPEQPYLLMQAAIGKPMGWREFVLKLKQLNPALIIMDGGYPNSIQLRIPDPRNLDPKDRGTTYVGGFKKKVLSEFDTATTDQWGVADKFERGWRTVVLNLIQYGYATKKDADRIFGEASGNQRSDLWAKKIQTKELNLKP